MGLVRAWRRQIYGASLVAILIPASIIVALFVVTGSSPLRGLGTLGQVFSGPAIPGGNLSARVSENSKPALPGSGGAGAAALRGHSPVIGQTATGGASPLHSSASPHGPTVTPVAPGTTPTQPHNGGQLHGGTGVGGSGGGGHQPPPTSRPPTTPTSTTAPTTTTNTTTAASLPPIVAIPPPPVTTTTTTTTPTTASSTSTSTTRTTTTSTTRTTTTSTTRTTTTPTTKTTTTTVTHTTTIKAPTTKTITRPGPPAVALATTVAQTEHGSATFTGCTGDWGVNGSGRVERVSRAATLHAASNGGASTID